MLEFKMEEGASIGVKWRRQGESELRKSKFTGEGIGCGSEELKKKLYNETLQAQRPT